MKQIKTILIACFCVVLNSIPAKAETIQLESAAYTILGVSSGLTNVGVRLGVWNGTQFIQAVTGTANAGYAALTGDEMGVYLSQTNNDIYSSSTLLAIAVYTDGTTLDYGPLDYNSNLLYRAILTDTSWQAGALSNTTVPRVLNFTANTTAAVGSFTFNATGPEVITLIPEPSTGALMMIGAVGLVALRRLRKV